MKPERFVERMFYLDYTLKEITETVENYARYWQAYGPYDRQKRKEIRDHTRQTWDRLRRESSERQIAEYEARRARGECMRYCGGPAQAAMDLNRSFLFDLIRMHAHVEKSGRRRLDLGRVIGDPAGLAKIAEIILDEISDITITDRNDVCHTIRSIGCIESGPTALAAAVSQLSHERSLDPSPVRNDTALCSFTVRPGGEDRIYGRARSPAVLVSDVVADPGAVAEAIGHLRQGGVRISHVIALVHSGTKSYRVIGKHGVEMSFVFPESAFEMPDYDSWAESCKRRMSGQD